MVYLSSGPGIPYRLDHVGACPERKCTRIFADPYYMFSFVVGVRMVLRVKGNPKRRYYQALAIYIGRPKNIYRYFKEDKKDERERDSASPGRHTYYRV